ncbi:hypothetical protein [Flammeovirga sp. SubArs3]|uniref:hypothetical protein n=1 Tax=Flammeovirga sp. SubArs3 TaxID=2995316 RepID=UPI00248CC188|nr:hypothetical protein [Flammeovirga sp. SubArs3]
MSTLDLKNLWQQQSSSQPNVEEVLQKAKSYKKKSQQSMIISHITAFGTIAYLLFIAFYYDPEVILPKIGIGLSILAVVIYIYSINALYQLVNNIGFDTTSIDYIKKLKEIKEKQRKIQTTTTSLYFILFSLGLGFYMAEYLVALSPNYSIPIAITTIIWVGINWFIFRPRLIRKQTKKIDELIKYFGDLEKNVD